METDHDLRLRVYKPSARTIIRLNDETKVAKHKNQFTPPHV